MLQLLKPECPRARIPQLRSLQAAVTEALNLEAAGEGRSPVISWVKRVLSSGNSKCKGPEVGSQLNIQGTAGQSGPEEPMKPEIMTT